MKTLDRTDRLWWDENGCVLCEAHAGSYLTHAILDKPGRRSAWTPLGKWFLVTPADHAEAKDNDWEIRCETCHPSAR